jgi:phosphocarrier protein HPr
MSERNATIASRVGLHARPAAIFAGAVGDLDLEVTIALEGDPVDDAMDASSILSLMSLGAGEDRRRAGVQADAAGDGGVTF